MSESGKCLSTIKEEDQFYALDYRKDGSVFAATGKNHTVRTPLDRGGIDENGWSRFDPKLSLGWQKAEFGWFRLVRRLNLNAASNHDLIQLWILASATTLTLVDKVTRLCFLLKILHNGQVRFFPATCARLTKPNFELQVHIYDETTKHEISLLQGGSGYGSSSAPGHSNRIFAVKFHPEDPEVRVLWGLQIVVDYAYLDISIPSICMRGVLRPLSLVPRTLNDTLRPHQLATESMI